MNQFSTLSISLWEFSSSKSLFDRNDDKCGIVCISCLGNKKKSAPQWPIWGASKSPESLNRAKMTKIFLTIEESKWRLSTPVGPIQRHLLIVCWIIDWLIPTSYIIWQVEQYPSQYPNWNQWKMALWTLTDWVMCAVVYIIPWPLVNFLPPPPRLWFSSPQPVASYYKIYEWGGM